MESESWVLRPKTDVNPADTPITAVVVRREKKKLRWLQ